LVNRKIARAVHSDAEVIMKLKNCLTLIMKASLGGQAPEPSEERRDLSGDPHGVGLTMPGTAA
jgi:hypothetical protein